MSLQPKAVWGSVALGRGTAGLVSPRPAVQAQGQVQPRLQLEAELLVPQAVLNPKVRLS